MSIPYDVPTVTAVVALGAWAVFMLRYHFSTGGQWRRTATGRNAMNSSAVIVLLLLLVVTTRLLRDAPLPEPFPGQRVAALLVYLAATASGVQRIVVQARAQRDGRRAEKTLP